MDLEDIVKVVPLVIVTITIGKFIYDLISGAELKLREEYKFAKEFLGQENLKDLHPFVREKGYKAIAGSSIVTQREMEYILSLSNPVQCTNDYKRSIQLFDRDDKKGIFKLVYRKKYKSSWSLKWRKVWYLFCYFSTAFAAFVPFIYPNWFGPLGRLSIVMTFPVFGFYAWMGMNAFSKIVASERLMKAQYDHESRKQKESSESKNS